MRSLSSTRPQAVLEPDALAGQVVEFAKTSPKPVIAAWVGGEHVEKGRDVLVRGNIPTYETPEEAVRTYLHMYWYHRNLTLLYETPSELPLTEAPPKNHLKAMLRRTVKEGRTILTEEESKAFLGNYGIPVAIPYLVRDGRRRCRCRKNRISGDIESSLPSNYG